MFLSGGTDNVRPQKETEQQYPKDSKLTQAYENVELCLGTCTIMIWLQLQGMANKGHVTNTFNGKCFVNICQITFLFGTIFIPNVAASARHELSNADLRMSKQHIKSNSSWIGPLISSNATGNYFAVDIDVTFAPEKCCPRFVLLTEPMNSTLIQDGCFDVSAELLRALIVAGLSSERHMEIDRTDLIDAPEQRVSDFQSCTQSKSTRMFTCDMFNFNHLISPQNASIYAYYPCFERQSMDFTVDISLWTDTVSYQCKVLKPSSPCYRFYQKTHLPSVFGSIDIEDVDVVFSMVNFLSYQKCHKYIELFCAELFFQSVLQMDLFLHVDQCVLK